MPLRKKWSGGCAADIEIRFRFSVRLFLSILILYVFALALLMLMSAPVQVLLATGLLALSLMACARLPCVGWSRHTLIGATAHDDGSWTLTERSGRSLEGRLQAGKVFGSSLIFVCWQTADQRQAEAVLFADSCDALALRRLRAHLLSN